MTLGEQAEAALRVVREAPIMSFDTETSGVDWRRHSVVGYVITADKDANFYVPVRHGGGGNLMDPNCGPLQTPTDKTVQHSFEKELARAFLDRRQSGHLTIGHFTNFDAHMAANHGVLLGRNLEDTALNAAMLDEYARSYSLDSCAKVAGVTAKLGDDLYTHLAKQFGGDAKRSQMEHFWRLSGTDPLVSDYATGDGITTLELRAVQLAGITAEELGVIHRIESQLIWTVFRLERRGIRVDQDYISQLVDAVNKEIETARSKLPMRFNPRSNNDVRHLMETNGCIGWPMTEPSKNFPNGQPSFTEKWLKTTEPGRSIVAIRQLTNLLNTFVLPLRDQHTFEGRVHASLHQLKADEYGTVAGRFSCSGPNLQAIHKRNKELGRKFRRIFVPDNGMEFYEADYKQIEPCLFAHYSKDEGLLSGYRAVPPRDVHQLVADAFGCERDPTAKRMNMGIFTGMQPKTFAEHMGWDLARATEAHNQWFNTFPGVRTFQNLAKQVMKDSGYVRTILKRRCRMDFPQYAYRATSKIIQGSNADILKYKMLEADKWLESEGDKAHLLMTVHDSFEWQSPLGAEGEKLSKSLVEMCTDVQGPPFNLRVPLGMDVGRGMNWADATYGPLPSLMPGSAAA